MAYEIDETTALLARHVAALDGLAAKLTLPRQGQGQGQGLGLDFGPGQGQGLDFGQGNVLGTGLRLQIDDGDDAMTANNSNNAYKRVNSIVNTGALTSSSGTHDEDIMGLALRSQIQVSDFPPTPARLTIHHPSLSSTPPTSTPTPCAICFLTLSSLTLL